MYAPHRTIPHSVKYSTALTEITEHYRACFRLLPEFVAKMKIELLFFCAYNLIFLDLFNLLTIQ